MKKIEMMEKILILILQIGIAVTLLPFIGMFLITGGFSCTDYMPVTNVLTMLSPKLYGWFSLLNISLFVILVVMLRRCFKETKKIINGIAVPIALAVILGWLIDNRLDEAIFNHYFRNISNIFHYINILRLGIMILTGTIIFLIVIGLIYLPVTLLERLYKKYNIKN